jgi:tetratricopeptide (TPR) repeat protein
MAAGDRPDAQRLASALSSELGAFHSTRGAEGDAQKALAYFDISLKILEDIVAANPTSAEARRDLSVSQDKLGTFHAKRGAEGDAEKALAFFEASLNTCVDIVAANPTSAQARRDLSVSELMLGDFAAQREDWAMAVARIERAYAIQRDIHAANPANAVLLRELIVTATRRPDYFHKSGDVGAAEAAFEALLDLILEYVEQFPLDQTMQQVIEQYHEQLAARSIARTATRVPDEAVDQALADGAFMDFAQKQCTESGIDFQALPAAELRTIVRQILFQIDQQKTQS